MGWERRGLLLAESGRFVLTTPSFLYVTIFNIPLPLSPK